MHGNFDLLLTLTSGLAAALFLGYITQRLGLSPIVGYLLAGVAVGPNTPGFAANRELAEQLAEIGVILLMFGVGLHFHLKELLAVRWIAVPGAIFQGLVATILGAVAARFFGWDWTAGLVFGLAISIASTVVLVRVLADNHDLHTPAGHIAVGWLVVQDLLAVAVLVLLPAVFRGAAPQGEVPEINLAALPIALGWAALKIGVLVLLVVYLGGYFIPWLLARVAATRSRELFTLTVLVVALGVAVGSASIFGVSMALGAFLAGMVVGRSDFSLRAAAEALPMQDAFAVLFFVSVGMLFDPRFLLESPGLVAATLAIVMIGNPLAACAIAVVLGYPWRVALAVAVALAQIGEFSFILAALGNELKILPPEAASAIIAVAIVSISLNPLLYRLLDPLEAWAARRGWIGGPLTAHLPQGGASTAKPENDVPEAAAAHRAVVVGYGPIGHTLCQLLRSNEIEPTVVEMNLETVKRLRGSGLAAVYGDASHRETLRAAGVADAESLMLTASNMRNAPEVIRQARELNPDIHLLVRAAYMRESPALYKAGADHVFADEGEVALAMTESILEELGAIPDQIDRQRDRIRRDLFDAPTPLAEEPPMDEKVEQSLPESALPDPDTSEEITPHQD
jgi:CPA2 family monovalent cation:H+ antiporter-2